MMGASRFSGFYILSKPLKTACRSLPFATGLKPGVNEKACEISG
jgi:hypothetical protein